MFLLVLSKVAPGRRFVLRRNIIYGNGEDGIPIIDYTDISDRIIHIERNMIVRNAVAGIGCMSDVHRSVDEFIFGQSQSGLNNRAALISMFRMDPFSYVGGKHDDELLIKRMMKEAVHELGHVFDLRHCAEKECAMYLAKNLRSLDKKTDNFCSITLKELRAMEQSEESVIGGWRWLESHLMYREMIQQERQKREEKCFQLDFLSSLRIAT